MKASVREREREREREKSGGAHKEKSSLDPARKAAARLGGLQATQRGRVAGKLDAGARARGAQHTLLKGRLKHLAKKWAGERERKSRDNITAIKHRRTSLSPPSMQEEIGVVGGRLLACKYLAAMDRLWRRSCFDAALPTHTITSAPSSEMEK